MRDFGRWIGMYRRQRPSKCATLPWPPAFGWGAWDHQRSFQAFAATREKREVARQGDAQLRFDVRVDGVEDIENRLSQYGMLLNSDSWIHLPERVRNFSERRSPAHADRRDTPVRD